MANFLEINEYLVDSKGNKITDLVGTRYINNEQILSASLVKHRSEYFVTITLPSGKTIAVDVDGTPFADLTSAKEALVNFVSFLSKSNGGGNEGGGAQFTIDNESIIKDEDGKLRAAGLYSADTNSVSTTGELHESLENITTETYNNQEQINEMGIRVDGVENRVTTLEEKVN